MKKKNKLGFLLGAGIGAGITALFTTEKGKEYQKSISKACDDLIEKVKDIDADDVKETVNSKISEIKEGIKDLDKEKVADIASKKAKQLGEKAEELVEYAKEKGIPVLKDAASNLKDETIKVTKKVIDKLEKSKED